MPEYADWAGQDVRALHRRSVQVDKKVGLGKTSIVKPRKEKSAAGASRFVRARGISIAVRRHADYSAGDRHTLDATGCDAVVFCRQPAAKSAGDSFIVSRR